MSSVLRACSGVQFAFKSNEDGLGIQLIQSAIYCTIVGLSHFSHKQYTKTNTENKDDIFNLIVQQQLASRGWHRVNRQEELPTGGGRGGGRWQS